MIQLLITSTGKGYSPKSEWQSFDQQTKTFSTTKEAKDWIKKHYSKAKRKPMYVDLKEGGSKKIGYVIGFRNADYSHYPIDKWIQQDWIQFKEIKTISL